MNNKFNAGVYAFASILGFVAGGLFVRTQLNSTDTDEIDKLAEEVDIFDEES